MQIFFDYLIDCKLTYSHLKFNLSSPFFIDYLKSIAISATLFNIILFSKGPNHLLAHLKTSSKSIIFASLYSPYYISRKVEKELALQRILK